MKTLKLIYKINKKKEITIFNSYFVKKNKRRCLMIINNKMLPLEYKYEIKDNVINYLKVKLLILISDRLNFSNMFNNITSLIQFSTTSKNEIFNSCDYSKEGESSLDSNKKIINNDFENNISTSDFYDENIYKSNNSEKEKTKFYEYFTKTDSIIITDLLQIKKTNTNINNTESIAKDNKIFNIFFYSLNYSEMSAISIINLNNMFNKCSSITTISGISDWDISYNINMKSMFSECSSLKNISGISQWKTHNVTDMSYMFNGCSSLKTLPDISGWNTSNVIDMNNMFNGCSSLEYLPNISNWNIEHVANLNGLFYNCCLLKSLPDISKWKTDNVIDMSYMFFNCSSLKNLPDLNNWKTEKVKNNSNMFKGCSSLISYINIPKFLIANKDNICLFEGNSRSKTTEDIKAYKDVSLDNKTDLCNQKINDKLLNKKGLEKENRIGFCLKNFKYSIIEMIVSVKKNKNKIKIINSSFVKKYQKKCKIIYENKKNNLQNEFLIKSNKNELVKINLIFYEKILNIIDLFETSILKKNIYSFCELLMIEYKIDRKKNKIKIFGEKFVNKNKDKCIIIYKGKIFPLQAYFSINEIDCVDDKLEIIMMALNWISDKSYMFDKCLMLKEIHFFEEKEYLFDKYITILVESDLNFINSESNENFYLKQNQIKIIKNELQKNIIKESSSIKKLLESEYSLILFSGGYKNDINICKNMRNMFRNCSSLKYLPDISKWNTYNVTDMRNMFNNCSSLQYLPDISKWRTNNVTNIKNMFNNCSSLSSLPDISKWNTNNVTNMRYIFSKLSSLLSLPDISKWNTSNVNDMNCLFYYCYSLISLPDLSKWKTDNVKDISFMFSNCFALENLPDISKWNIYNVNDMSYMFSKCHSLKYLPDISKWNTNNVRDMSYMFNDCSSLKFLPDISKWNTKNVINMSCMFCDCSSLISLPDISKWKTDNVTDMSYMFFNCSSLKYLPALSKWNIRKVADKDFMFFNCLINNFNKYNI